MANRFLKLFGVIAIVAIIGFLGFVLIACDTGKSPGTGNNGDDTPLFTVSGKFNKSAAAGGGEVQFNLVAPNNNARSARSAASANTISGVLYDGDITIRLSGTFDPDTLSYSASAAASIIRYTINGAVDADGNSLGSTATVLIRENATSDNWQAFSFIITEAAVTISGTPQNSQAGGIPSFAHGNWHYNTRQTDRTIEMRVLVNQWDYILDQVFRFDDGRTDFHNIKVNILEVSGSGTTYDVILAFPRYEATMAQRAASITSYLTSRGVPVTQLQSQDQIVTGGYFFLFEDGGTSWGGFTDAQWEVVSQYFNTNALLQYLITNNIPPVTKFEKARIVFSNNNNSMTLMPYHDVSGNITFNTLAEARALTQFSAEQGATLTR